MEFNIVKEKLANLYKILYILPVLSLLFFPNVYFDFFGFEPNKNPALNDIILNICGGVVFLFLWIVIIYISEIFLWNIRPNQENDFSE